ncbi:MAG: FAD-dependent oxidoreductase [Alphaproteobacteria bacterium]|nr:FAD-dependent oxidoreductase [Alphaproteobacteria bacterium]
MTQSHTGMVIIGGGLAGFLAASMMSAKLIARGNSAPITIISDEPYLPYDRTALSKEFLMGGMDAGRLNLQPPNWYLTANIILNLGDRVVAIDREKNLLTLSQGSQIAYSGLVLALGARAHPLFSTALKKTDRRRIIALENLDDALYLREYLQLGMRLVIIGGGFIGLELASIAARMGCLVTVVEARNAMLSDVMMAEITERLIEIHRLRSVEFYTNDYCTGVNELADRVEVKLAQNGTLIADMVVVGIGITPNIDLAAASALKTDKNFGIIVNEFGQTDDPRIFAIGRCSCIAAPPEHNKVGKNPTENSEAEIIAVPRHLGAINDQINKMVAHMFHEPSPPANLPLITSEQYGIELSILGEGFSAEPVLWRGHPLREPTIAFITEEGRVIGAVGFNAGQDIPHVTSIINSQKRFSPENLVDLRVKLSDLAKKAGKK